MVHQSNICPVDLDSSVIRYLHFL